MNRFFFFLPLLMISGCSLSFAEQANDLELPPAPPEVGPYQLPTFSGKPARIDNKIRSLVTAPRINGDVLFQTIMQCYPTVSKWKVDVALRAGASTKRLASDFGTDLGKNYVQIVANMPLYSTSEVEKGQDREYKRRQETAQNVSVFVASIAERNHAIRELSLYQSLESRASLRVASGFIAASEQVQYLEKVAKAQETLIKSEADIMSSRISLSAQCRSGVYKKVNDWLTRLSAIPKSKWQAPIKTTKQQVTQKDEDPLLIEWGKSLGFVQ